MIGGVGFGDYVTKQIGKKPRGVGRWGRKKQCQVCLFPFTRKEKTQISLFDFLLGLIAQNWVTLTTLDAGTVRMLWN